MALSYANPKYTAAAALAAMDAADVKNGKPVGTTKDKQITMGTLATFDATTKNWVDKFVVDTINSLPEEQYLDQVNTKVVENFNFASGSYPTGTTNPNLDGKPVLVFAIKNASDTTKPVTYSFVSLEKLIDAYTADNTTTKAVDVTVSTDNKISAELNLHTITGEEKANAAVLKDDGLYVPTFDDSDITDRLDDLEAIVGTEANAETSAPATGLVKAVADNTTAIGKATTYKKDTDGVTDIVDVAGTGIIKDIEDVKAGLAALGGGTGSIATQIQTAIEALDASVNNTADASAVTVTVTEVDGKLTAVTATLDESKVLGVKADTATSTAATGVYKYVDDAVKAVQDSLTYATDDDIESIFG